MFERSGGLRLTIYAKIKATTTGGREKGQRAMRYSFRLPVLHSKYGIQEACVHRQMFDPVTGSAWGKINLKAYRILMEDKIYPGLTMSTD